MLENLTIHEVHERQLEIDMVLRFMRFIGPLRTMLYLLILALAVMSVFSMGGTEKSGLMMMPTLIAPAIVPMLFFVLPLDMTMCWIMMSGKSKAKRQRYRHLIQLNCLAFLLLLGAWFPFYARLLGI